MSDWTLCIDFGTAYSKAAVAPTGAWSRFDPASVRPLMLSAEGQNAFLLDSAVFVDEDRVLFGRAALNEADAQADNKRAALRSFKTLLSVSDLERALNTNAPATIDPHRIFQMRDLIVLYLAYLLASIERAITTDPILAQGGTFARRYAAPAWRSGDSAGMHDVVVRLFGEAEAFRAAVGKRILSPDGISLRTISDALPKAMERAEALEMGLIFEATAAAAYTSAGLEGSGSHIIVVDMGAGTTDIAALARLGPRTIELPEARYKEFSKQSQYRRALLDEVNTLPGIQASLVSEVPLSGDWLTHNFLTEEQQLAEGSEPDVQTVSVEGDFFNTMQIPLLSGRDFSIQDHETSPLVGIVNQTLVRQFFSGQNPIGKRVEVGLERSVPLAGGALRGRQAGRRRRPRP